MKRLTDAQRLDFIAELMNLSAIVEMGGRKTLPQERQDHLASRSSKIFQQYQVHRHRVDTPIAFRMAVDDAADDTE